MLLALNMLVNKGEHHDSGAQFWFLIGTLSFVNCERMGFCERGEIKAFFLLKYYIHCFLFNINKMKSHSYCIDR